MTIGRPKCVVDDEVGNEAVRATDGMCQVCVRQAVGVSRDTRNERREGRMMGLRDWRMSAVIVGEIISMEVQRLFRSKKGARADRGTPPAYVRRPRAASNKRMPNIEIMQ